MAPVLSQSRGSSEQLCPGVASTLLPQPPFTTEPPTLHAVSCRVQAGQCKGTDLSFASISNGTKTQMTTWQRWLVPSPRGGGTQTLLGGCCFKPGLGRVASHLACSHRLPLATTSMDRPTGTTVQAGPTETGDVLPTGSGTT